MTPIETPQELEQDDAIVVGVILARTGWTTPEQRKALLAAKVENAIKSLERAAIARWGA